MSNQYVILRVDCDDDHDIYGPFDSEAEAKEVLAAFAANNPEYYSTDNGKTVMKDDDEKDDDDEYGGTIYLAIICTLSPESLLQPKINEKS